MFTFLFIPFLITTSVAQPLSAGTHSYPLTDFTGQNLTLKGVSKETVTIKGTDDNYLFYGKPGNLSLSQLTFIPNAAAYLIDAHGPTTTVDVSHCVVNGSSLSAPLERLVLIYFHQATATLDHLTICYCTFRDGAAVGVSSGEVSNLTMKNSEFSSLTRQLTGPVAFATSTSEGTTYTFENVTVTDCCCLNQDYTDPADPEAWETTAFGKGGVFHFIPRFSDVFGSLTLKSCKFVNCSVRNGSGAAVRVERFQSVLIEDCEIYNASSSGWRSQGAAIQIYKCIDTDIINCLMENCTVQEGSYQSYAGGITFHQNTGRCVVKNCHFKKCSSQGSAAFHAAHNTKSLTLQHCLFEACYCSDFGLTTHLYGNNETTLSNCTFLECGSPPSKNTTVLNIRGPGTNILSLTDILVVPNFDLNPTGRIHLYEMFNTSTPTVTASNCAFLSAPAHLLKDNVSSTHPQIGFPILHVTKAKSNEKDEGEDTLMCAHPHRKCKHLSHAVTLCRGTEGLDVAITVKLAAHQHSEDEVAVGNSRVDVRGEDGQIEATIVSSKGGQTLFSVGGGWLKLSFFTIALSPSADAQTMVESAGTLILTSLVLVKSSPSPTYSSPLLTVSEGTTTISSTTLPLLSFDALVSLIDVQDGGKLVFEAHSFSWGEEKVHTFARVEGTVEMSNFAVENGKLVNSLLTGSGSLVLTRSTLTNLSPSISASARNGDQTGSISAITLTVEDKDTTLQSVSFTKCSSSGDGGAMNVKVTGTGTLRMETVSFNSCVAVGNGGGFALDFSEMSSEPSLVLTGITFGEKSGEEDESCSATLGSAFSLVGSAIQTRVNVAPFLTFKPAISPNVLFSDAQKEEFFGFDTNGTVGSLLFFWYPHTSSSGAVHVHKDGEDHVLCGVAELPCSVLSSSFSKTHSTSTVIDSVLVFNEVISSIASPHSLSSTISNEITVDPSASFVVSSSSLSIQTCSFVSAGTLRTSSLLTLSGSGAATLTSCSFSLFSSTVGGSVVSGTIKAGSSLVVDGCAFTSCVSKEKGGVIAVSLEGTGKIETKNTNTFSSCSSETGEGNWISITSADLVSFLSSGALTSIRPNSTNNALFGNEEKKKYFGADTNETSGSLLFFWYPHTTAEQSTHIHVDGEDHPLCGQIPLPCSSFNMTLSHPNANNKFVVNSAMTLKEGLTIAAATILTSSTSKQTITATSTASITVPQDSLTLLDLSLTGSSHMAPFLSLSSSGSLILDSCSFSSFSNTQSDGSVLSGVLGSATKLEISECSFEKCKSVGNGGVIAVDLCDLTNPSNLVLSSLTFGGADTDEANLCGEGKLGQNVYVVSNPSQKPTLKTIFGSVLPLKPANDASFFSSSEMNRMEFGEKSSGVVSAIGSLLFVVFSYDGGDLTVDESSPIVHSLCGHSFLPCSSLSAGYSLVKKAGDTAGRLLVRGPASLDATITTTDKAATMTSSTSEVETVSVGSGKYFWICKGSLAVSSLAFVNASESFDNSVFILSGVGSLSLSDCSFTGFSSSVKGSVISGDVGGGLEVSGCSFKSCSSTQKDGSWISISSDNLVTFLSSSLTSLKPAIPTSLFSSEEKKKCYGVDTATNSEGSLLFFWYPHTSSSGAVHVHKDGEDHVLCGVAELPCSVLSSSFSKTHSTSTVIDSALVFNEKISTITSPHSLSSTLTNEITVDTDASFVVSSSSLSIQTCSFVSAGTLRTSSFLTLSGSGAATLTSCSFSLFSSTVGGSVVSGTIKAGSSLVVDGCAFTSCVSKEKGGVIAVSLEGTGKIETKNTNTFSSCSSETGEGNWISITSADLVSFLSSGALTSIRPNSTNNALFGNEEKKNFFGADTNGTVGSLLFFWYPHTSSSGAVHVHKDGEDHLLCGVTTLPCQSFLTSLPKMKGVSPSIQLDTNTVLSTKLSTSISNWTLTRSSDVSLTIEEAGQIVIDADSTTHTIIQSVNIVVGTLTANRQTPVFSVSAPKLSLKSCSVSSLPSAQDSSTPATVLGASLFVVTKTGSVELDTSTFTLFTSTKPSILTASGDSFTVHINACSFDSCSTTSKTDSGVLSIAHSGQSSFILSEATTITTCTSPSTSPSDFLFFSHASLSRTILDKSLTLEWDQTANSKRLFVGEEKTGDIPIPLYLFYTQLSTPIHLSSPGCDVSICGSAVYPCAGLVTALAHLPASGERSLAVDGNVAHSGEIVLVDNLVIDGGSHTFTIVPSAPSDSSPGLFTISALVSISDLDFVIPDTFTHPTLLHCTTNKLSLTKCSIAQSGTGPIDGCVILVKDGASLVVFQCEFRSVSSSLTSAGVIVAHISESSTFSVSDTTFSSCTCARGSAHSIWMEFVNSSTNTFSYLMTQLHFTSSTLSRNADTSANIDVYVTGKNLDTIIKQSQWEGSYSALKGSSLFAVDKATLVESSLIPYLEEITGLVEVDDSGYNFTKCGHFGLFCNSSEVGQERMAQAGLSVMKVVNCLTLTGELSFVGSNTVTGEERTSQLILTSTAQVKHTPASSEDRLSFETLTISLPTQSKHSSPIVVSVGTISFSSCVLSAKSNTLATPAISLTSGALQATDLSTTPIHLQNSALIVSSATIQLTSCQFIDVTRDADEATVIDTTLTESVSLTATQTSFAGCLSNAQPRWIRIRGTNTLTFKPTSWTGTFNTSSPRDAIIVEVDPLAIKPGFNKFSLLYKLYPCPDSHITVETTSSSVDHPLCGHSQLPCRSIDEGMRLTEKRVVEVHNSATISSKFAMDGDELTIRRMKGHSVVRMEESGSFVNNEFYEPDSLILSAITLDLSSTKLTTNDALILNENGETEIVSVNVTSTTTVKPTLISLTGGDLNISGLIISSITFSTAPFAISSADTAQIREMEMSSCSLAASNDDDEKEDTICSWKTGLVQITDSTVSIHFSTFSHLSHSALVLTNSNISLETSAFRDNAMSEEFPSARRNIHCESGEVHVGTLSGGDGFETLSHWISSTENCSVTKSAQALKAPLFVPVMDTKGTSAKAGKKYADFSVTIAGATFIPCGLSLEVFEVDTNKVEKTKFTHVLTPESTSSFSESRITLSLTASQIGLKDEFEWRARLAHGNGETSPDFSIKPSSADIRKAQSKQAMKWILPLIGGLLALLAILLIVFVLIRKRRKDKAKQPKLSELDEHPFQLEVKDDDLFGVVQTDAGMDPTTFLGQKTTTALPESEITDRTNIPPEVGVAGDNEMSATGYVEAIACDNVQQTTRLPRMSSLYFRLHKQFPRPEINTADIFKQVTRGLENLINQDPKSPAFTRLSPHVVVFDADGKAHLKVDADKRSFLAEGQVLQPSLQTGHEGIRWEAPEVAAKSESVDAGKAAVFSLGLMIWEVETGEVPFKEMDAVNAQRAAGTGTLPNMTGFDEGLKELITNCLRPNPDDRIPLHTITSFFWEKGETKMTTHNQHVPQLDGGVLPSVQ